MAPSTVLSRVCVLLLRERSRVPKLTTFLAFPLTREGSLRHYSSHNVDRTAASVTATSTENISSTAKAAAAAAAAASSSQDQPSVLLKQPKVADSEVTVEYRGGLPELTVTLPSRKEKCMFRLRPVSHVVGDLVQMLKHEDRGIDRVSISTMDGVRIGATNSIESLMQDNFKLLLNDVEYVVRVPPVQRLSQEQSQQLSDLRLLVSRLYESLNVQEHQLLVERELLARLEQTRLELMPMEEVAQEISKTADTWVRFSSYAFLYFMGVQFGILARLTWWEYSWDIMEPVTYFVTYGTIMAAYARCLITNQEDGFRETRSRQFLIRFHKEARKRGFDVQRYNELKETAYHIEKLLAKLRDPLQVHLPARSDFLSTPPPRSVLSRAQEGIKNLLNIRNKVLMPSSSISSSSSSSKPSS